MYNTRMGSIKIARLITERFYLTTLKIKNNPSAMAFGENREQTKYFQSKTIVIVDSVDNPATDRIAGNAGRSYYYVRVGKEKNVH